jgi:hypothetical protein
LCGVTDTDTDGNGDCNCYCYCYGHRDANSNSNTDVNTCVDPKGSPDAETSADSPPAPVDRNLNR